MDLSEVKNISSLEDRHPWERARLEVLKSLLKKYFSDFFSKDCICFDIGCGDTFIAEQLAEMFPRSTFYAIDTAFDDKMINAYREKFGNTNVLVFKTLDEAVKFANRTIDVVLLLDVLEHIEDDILFLKEILNNKYITEKTSLIITVPAFQSLFCSHDKVLYHYKRYNNSELQKTITDAGFQKHAMGYFFFILILPRILEVVLEKLFKKEREQTQLKSWNHGHFINNIFRSILILDFKVNFTLRKIGIKFPGLSNYIVCKKSV